jgi:transposase
MGKQGRDTLLQSFERVCGTLRNWWQPILNYFVGRVNNGFAEGVNLKIKMLNLRGLGYRNFKSLRLHLLVASIQFSRQKR